jgi:hypothetical protein
MAKQMAAIRFKSIEIVSFVMKIQRINDFSFYIEKVIDFFSKFGKTKINRNNEESIDHAGLRGITCCM